MVFGLGESSLLSKKVRFLVELTAVCASYLKLFWKDKRVVCINGTVVFPLFPATQYISLALSSFHAVSFQACDLNYSAK